MITKDKVTEIFCILDEFSKNFNVETQKNALPCTDGKRRRNRKGISFVDSTMVPVCHNLRRYANRVFEGVSLLILVE